MFMEESMTSLGLLVAALMIVVGVFLIGFLLLLRNRYEQFTESSTNESIPSYGDCYDLCKGDSVEASTSCVGLCAYGWP
jgi:hypothetical protein